jgi:hypothetical protein
LVVGELLREELRPDLSRYLGVERLGQHLGEMEEDVGHALPLRSATAAVK